MSPCDRWYPHDSDGKQLHSDREAFAICMTGAQDLHKSYLGPHVDHANHIIR